jgi:S1-C subfamily serine protease
MKELKNALLCGLVIIQYIQSMYCYIPNKTPMYMKLGGANLKHSLITKRREMIFYSIALNTLNSKKVNAEQSVIDNKISSKDIIKYIEEEQTNIFEKSISSVCYISTEYSSMADKYNLNKEDLPKGVGTGFIWDKKGHIITNFHVINKVDKALVTITDINRVKRTYVAKLTGVDPDTDLAILKIDAPESELQVINYNKDVKPRIGQFAFAIGNPFGQDHTFTTGIISAINREITAPTGRKIFGIIQTDAAINPGNSGGPLLNSDGEIIGINTASLGMGVSAGIGFAIPISSALKSISDIIDTGYVQKAILGISYMERNPSIVESEKSGIPIIAKGILILDVPKQSPAYAAGLQGITRDEKTKKVISIGDIIIAINNMPINNPDNLNIILKNFKPNDKIIIKYLRNNKEYTTSLILGSYKGATFTLLENERGKNFDDERKPVDIPLKNLEPVIQPKLN